jgi:hypothetical protein
MKTILMYFLILTTLSAASQPTGYTRGGAEATAKSMKLLFTESFLFAKGTLDVKIDSKPAVLEAIAESDNVIAEYEQKVDEFLKSKPVASVLKNQYTEIVSKVNGSSYAIEKAASAKNEYRVMSAVSFLQDLYLYRAYIKAAVKVYPEAISMEEKLEAIEEAIKLHGSREDYIAKMEKNQLDYLKNLRIKKAVMNDPILEGIAKKDYETSWAADKVSVVKVHITTGWTIEKNVLDIPVSKEVEVNFAIKKADGTCALAAGRMYSVYEGGGKYGKPYLIMPSPPITIPCENLTK